MSVFLDLRTVSGTLRRLRNNIHVHMEYVLVKYLPPQKANVIDGFKIFVFTWGTAYGKFL